MFRIHRRGAWPSGLALPLLLTVSLSACGPTYSPDIYTPTAVQQANKVEQGVVVGVRAVQVSAQGTTGAVLGGTAGAAVGSQVGGGGLSETFGAIGGTLVGGLIGTTAEHTVADTAAWEYVVRKPNGEMVSVTQKDATPLALGQKVLVIAGNQARIVPDYTVQPTPEPAKDKAAQGDKPPEEAKPPEPAKDKPAEPAPTPTPTPELPLPTLPRTASPTDLPMKLAPQLAPTAAQLAL